MDSLDPSITPDTITPDTKDWTWVLERPCAECAFDGREVDVSVIGDTIRAVAGRWPPVLDRPDVRQRPQPDIWSPLEYGCHVRDVFRRFDTRLQLMLTEIDPRFENWDQDATAITDRYADDDPATVAVDLVAAAEGIAGRFEAVRADEWSRTGRRSDGAVFTVETLARYFIHDPIHHLVDVGAVPTL